MANYSPKENVLLITFNTTLVKYLEAIIGSELPENIHVRNYHKFARGYLSNRGKMPRCNGIVSGIEDGDTRKLLLVKKALESLRTQNPTNSTYKRDNIVFLEEISWIEKMGITSLIEYEATERIGRSDTRIKRENRKYFYTVYEEYKRIRKEEGYWYDWEDIAQAVYNELLEDQNERMYKHIVIDEGQDLSPIMLKSLVNAIPQDGSLTFFGDVAQQIYGSRLSWRDAGINIDKKKIWRFDRNYRNSREIARFAIAISKSRYFESVSDLVEPIMPTASSPLPAVVKFKDKENEVKWIVENAVKASTGQSIAILMRNRELVNMVEEKIKEQGIVPQVLKNKMGMMQINAKISIGTYHSAKGLEFDLIMLPFCSQEYLPGQDKIMALESRDEALREDIKLIYVAVTRARRGLIISYSGVKTELLPNNEDNLYIEREIR